jgi:hypothetical protein
LTDKAKQAGVEHKDELHKAVEKAENLADKQTQGKYHDQIQKAGAKVDAQLDELAKKQEDPPAEGRPASDPKSE